MPVSSDGYMVGRRRRRLPPTFLRKPGTVRVAWTRVIGLALVLLGVIVTVLALISAAMR